MTEGDWLHELGTLLLGELAERLAETRRKLEREDVQGERRLYAEAFVRHAEEMLRRSKFVQ